jgi:predicted Rossmann fold flavoprotein
MLLAECVRGGVDLVLNARGITVETSGSGGFRVCCSAGEFTADALVVATGGLSIPKMGASGLGYQLARQFGLAIVPPRAALVPLLLGGEEAAWTGLAGVAAEVEASAGAGRTDHPSGVKALGHPGDRMLGVKPIPFREKMLVTHRGLSGPAVLQASSFWLPGSTLALNLSPDRAVLGGLLEPRARRDSAALRQALKQVLPQRLAAFLAETAGPDGWSNTALEAYEHRLHAWQLHPVGTEGFEKAEVTAGGVDTDGLHARTMEARAVRGLYFIGEVVDVTGWLGGFNFQWAWASAVAAGNAC